MKVVTAAAAFLQAIIICACTHIDSSTTNVSQSETDEANLQTSTSVMSKDFSVQPSAGKTEIETISQTYSISTMRRIDSGSQTSTTAESTMTSISPSDYSKINPTVSILSSSIPVVQLVTTMINATYSFSINPSEFSKSQSVDITQVPFSTHLFASTSYEIDLTNQVTVSVFQTSEFENFPTSSMSEYAEVKSYTTVILSWSSNPDSYSSKTVSQSWSSQVQPTSAAHFLPTSVTNFQTAIASQSATHMTVTPTTESQSHQPTPSKTSNVKSPEEDLSPGTKVAIGVIIAVCLLGVVVAIVVVYQRYNITHRSLKSFLTSGVRYKTYNNATYKDDEDMLIMPDDR